MLKITNSAKFAALALFVIIIAGGLVYNQWVLQSELTSQIKYDQQLQSQNQKLWGTLVKVTPTATPSATIAPKVTKTVK